MPYNPEFAMADMELGKPNVSVYLLDEPSRSVTLTTSRQLSPTHSIPVSWIPSNASLQARLLNGLLSIPKSDSISYPSISFILHAKKTAFVIEHDFIMATYLADRVIVFEGQPAISATATP